MDDTFDLDEKLLGKLKYKGGRAGIAKKPESFATSLESADQPEGQYGFLLVFVTNAAETMEWVNKAIPHLEEDAVFWLAYPKKTSHIKTDINRDIIWRLVEDRTDYRLVSNVAIDDTWSALRLRHKDKTTRKDKG